MSLVAHVNELLIHSTARKKNASLCPYAATALYIIDNIGFHFFYFFSKKAKNPLKDKEHPDYIYVFLTITSIFLLAFL